MQRGGSCVSARRVARAPSRFAFRQWLVSSYPTCQVQFLTEGKPRSGLRYNCIDPFRPDADWRRYADTPTSQWLQLTRRRMVADSAT